VLQFLFVKDVDVVPRYPLSIIHMIWGRTSWRQYYAIQVHILFNHYSQNVLQFS